MVNKTAYNGIFKRLSQNPKFDYTYLIYNIKKVEKLMHYIEK